MNNGILPTRIPTTNLSADSVQVFTPPPSGEPPKKQDLYSRRKKIHPRDITGIFQNLRVVTAWGVLVLYFLLPWITWKGRQAILFDLPNRKFYIFGWTFLPQDFILLSWLLICAALALFVITVFAGRVYCGYVCPQTVWTKLFMWTEKLTEGSRNARIKLDKSTISFNKVLRRGAKHLIWLLIAFWTAFTFVGYFSSIAGIYEEIKTLQVGPWELLWFTFFTLMTYLNAGWMREQVCMYMCPYGRFQSSMFDKDTLIISYDAARGESRGARKKGADYKEEGLGDCIDCQLCVQVCPTGIDIRNGLQFECIACAACIDACDSVMDKMGYDRGLVLYTTERQLYEHKQSRILRPKLIAYSLVLVGMLIIVSTQLGTRVPLGLDVIRDRNQLFRETPDGMIENVYTLKIINMQQNTKHFKLALHSDIPLELEADSEVSVGPGDVLPVPVAVKGDPGLFKTPHIDINFSVSDTEDEKISAETESRFFSPALGR